MENLAGKIHLRYEVGLPYIPSALFNRLFLPLEVYLLDVCFLDVCFRRLFLPLDVQFF
jgi:hypothetical protein